jgi:hypothetical protein
VSKYYYRIKSSGGSKFSEGYGHPKGGKAGPIINVHITPPKWQKVVISKKFLLKLVSRSL